MSLDVTTLALAKSYADQHSGGGGQVQPDWNQNDSTAADYVKNRPFYTGDPVETVLVEESTVPFEDGGGVYMAGLESTFVSTVGETYKVYWDGTVYECICTDFNRRKAIGNLSIINKGSDTGEPFLMNIIDGMSIEIATKDASASHTFSISGFVQEVVKIDEKYLPKGFIVKVVGRESNSGNTYLLFDKTDEEIYNAANNGIAVTLEFEGFNLQFKGFDEMFWGVIPYTVGSNGITELKVLYVNRTSSGWLLKETYITASTDSNS